RGTYVVRCSHPACLQRFLETEVEIGCVYTDEQIGRLGDQAPFQFTANAQSRRQQAQDLDIAAHSQRLRGEPGLKARGLHLRTTETENPGRRRRLLQSAHQMCAE